MPHTLIYCPPSNSAALKIMQNFHPRHTLIYDLLCVESIYVYLFKIIFMVLFSKIPSESNNFISHHEPSSKQCDCALTFFELLLAYLIYG